MYIARFEVLCAEYSTRRVWSRGPIQHEAKPSAVLRARDHVLRVLYSAGTARTKRALTNMYMFNSILGGCKWKCLAYHFDCPLSGSDWLTGWEK